ncbi:glycosyltransferase [Oscillatoriales cyanobacterium LEGE 11467]|uniref:Glycosyltransferase n=1 Tax=Zarconia navalis LEGE 11467 TaxID=1828826 RepID=A0A928VYD9_9CYAN|nr:glycosyltransferase [Zarconia navalis]MBE9042396.1 glycosyltransferase [Zarconia navalis LEGE 11467]
MNPIVSVVIPTYNSDRYIAAAIDSVLAQTYPHWEILVVDDGSQDRTQQILQPIVREVGDRLRYIYQTNQGVSAARNRGIEAARGEFVAFLDADDIFLPDKLAAQIEVFAVQTQLGMVHSGWRRVDAVGKPLLDVEPWREIPTLDLESWLRWKPVLPSAMMFRRQWLLEAGGFDSRFPPAEDTELVLRLALRGCKAAWLRQITVLYRQHEDSAMYKGLPQARSLSAVLDHFFAQPDVPPHIRLLEPDIRYSTWVWIGWYLYGTGHLVEMGEALQQAWQYSPYSALEAIINWVESFAAFSKNIGKVLDAEVLVTSAQWQDVTAWVSQNNEKLSIKN